MTNINITTFTIHPNREALEPEIMIQANYTYEDTGRIPLSATGYLFLNNQRVALLTEISNNRRNDYTLRYRQPSSRDICYDSRTFIAPLSRIVLSKLEEARSKNPKGDVLMSCKIEIAFLEPSFMKYTNKSFENVVMTGLRNGDELLKLTYGNYDQTVRIGLSDWVADFCPVFENRQYQVFEIPVPKPSKKNNEINKRIDLAIKGLEEVSNARLKGDWNLVMKECRPVWELARNKAEIQKLLETEHLDESTIQNFNTLIDTLFDFSSKFAHKISKSKTIMHNNASKEDAEFVYAIAFALVNLIATKLTRD